MLLMRHRVSCAPVVDISSDRTWRDDSPPMWIRSDIRPIPDRVSSLLYALAQIDLFVIEEESRIEEVPPRRGPLCE